MAYTSSVGFEAHCWAEVDLDAIRNNYRLVRRRVGDVPICAVIKADAYGHGDLEVARIAAEEGAAWFAVSCLAEAEHLRRGGIAQPILILGMTQPAYARSLANQNITQTVFSPEYAQALAAAAKAAGVTVQCHLKADTGMGRLGFDLRADFDRAVEGLKACCRLEGLEVTGMFQHFAVADACGMACETFTEGQYRLFQRAVTLVRQVHPLAVVHSCNSAGLMQHPEWGCDMVRAGIVLYGHDPSGEVHLEGLRPAMQFKTVVSHVKDLLPGESVSYGRTFISRHPMRVATLCCGYADGYPRLLSGKGVVSIRGKAAPVLGRVCMDQMMVDVTDIPEVEPGDEVIVLGGGAADRFSDAADKIDTIPYELLCGIARRVPRVFLRKGRPVNTTDYLSQQ